MSAEPHQDYLADGIVEAITAALSCIRSFFVIARSSAFTYKGRTTNARHIGKELGVAYLLEGSVQKAGNRLRIIVQLIETDTGAHVWSSRFGELKADGGRPVARSFAAVLAICLCASRGSTSVSTSTSLSCSECHHRRAPATMQGECNFAAGHSRTE